MPPPLCVGDRNDDRTVAVDELVTGVRINLDLAALSLCPQFDSNEDLRVAIHELIQGVNNDLHGCPR